MTQPKRESWDQFWKKQHREFENPSWSKKRILKIIHPFLNQNNKVLDAGCGSGFFSKVFCDHQMDVTSLDYSREALKMTRKVTNERARCFLNNLLDPHFPQIVTDRFSLIFSDGLLEHFNHAQQIQILRNLCAVLKRKGRIITFVPNRFSPWQIIRPFYMPGINETPFTAEGLVSVHKEVNLQIEKAEGINTFPFAFSPDKLMGKYLGMLLYVIGKK